MDTSVDAGKAQILLVEDDPVLAQNILINLELDGFSVTHVANLREAAQANSKLQLNLVILDLNLPDGHGFEFLEKLRKNESRIPVIILTAVSDEDSVVEGLQRGADDYMRKPFGNKELSARIKAVLRVPLFREKQLRFGSLLLLLEQRVVKCGDKTIALHRREFDILRHLVDRAETIISRTALLQSLDKDGEIFDRTIDSHVSHLRANLKKANVTDMKIASVYGVGYRLEKI